MAYTGRVARGRAKWHGVAMDEVEALALYAFVLFICAVAYWVLERTVIALGDADSALASTIGNDLKRKVSLSVYALAIACSCTFLAFVILTAMAALWFVPDTKIERRVLRQHADEP
jgi:uncharacterized membrane protein